MGLDLNDVETTISGMDLHYDANFGTWIRTEKNASIIGHHLKKYIDDYHISDFIVVLKWIMRTWTLRSIIILMRSMMSDLKNSFRHRILIINGLFYTWNNIFIAEFVIAMTKEMNVDEKCMFYANVFRCFDNNKNEMILQMVADKVENKVKRVLKSVYGKKRNKIRLNEDLVKAFILK